MKWGIVDNYQQPKKSFYYVQRAYQPLLVSLKFDRRRWQNNEPFKGELWIVNDLYKDYSACTLKMNIRDHSGTELLAKSYDIKAIESNSSRMFIEFKEVVLDGVKDSFNVDLVLLDRDGKELSKNTYLFLIGDQQAATKKMKELQRR